MVSLWLLTCLRSFLWELWTWARRRVRLSGRRLFGWLPMETFPCFSWYCHNQPQLSSITRGPSKKPLPADMFFAAHVCSAMMIYCPVLHWARSGHSPHIMMSIIICSNVQLLFNRQLSASALIIPRTYWTDWLLPLCLLQIFCLILRRMAYLCILRSEALLS